jgi:glycosyltransferase involved in cell wall biosynthesis
MNELSVCLIVKNGAGSLRACLDSVRPIANEIIVVDTGSTDNSIHIAEFYGATIIQSPWVNNFAYSRNVSIFRATKPWIMWIDADEVLCPDSIGLINEIKNTEPEQCYACKTQNIYPHVIANGFVRTEPFRQIKIFPNFKNITFDGNIHESVAHVSKYLGIPCKDSEVLIYHHGYSDEKIVREKFRRDVKLMLVKFGYSPEQEYIEFSIEDKYNCFYAPNMLTIWEGLSMIGAVELKPSILPENIDEKRIVFLENANKIISEYLAGLKDSEKLVMEEINRMEKNLGLNKEEVLFV